MISTQRLLLIFFAINLVMGIVTQFYNNPTRTDLDTTIYTNEQSKINEQANTYTSTDTQYSGIKNKAQITDPSIGNPISWGATLLSIFGNALNPFSINPTQFETTIEQIFAGIISIIRTMMIIITLIEAYMLFKNKKNS